MSFFSTKDDLLFEKATTDLEDFELNLDIADKIKGKQIHPKTGKKRRILTRFLQPFRY